MPLFGPISCLDLIRGLRALGFAGPVSGGRLEFMVRGNHRLAIPNPHRGVLGVNLSGRILRPPASAGTKGSRSGHWIDSGQSLGYVILCRVPSVRVDS